MSANHITDESSIKTKPTIQQMDLFIDYEQLKKEEEEKLEINGDYCERQRNYSKKLN